MKTEIGKIYKHYKGKYYLIKGFANDGKLVYYQQLYGNFGHWIRDIDEFESPLDDGSERYQCIDCVTNDNSETSKKNAILEIFDNLKLIDTFDQNSEILPIKNGLYKNSQEFAVFLAVVYDHNMNRFVCVTPCAFLGNENCKSNCKVIHYNEFVNNWTFVSNSNLIFPKW